MNLFDLRGTQTVQEKLICMILGSIVILGVWSYITYSGFIPNSILPPPWKVLTAFKELHYDDALLRNAGFSFKLNVLGCLEATLIAIPIGFLIGLFPIFKSAFAPYISALRFLPLTAVIGLFVCWFGIYSTMKVQFLSFAIFLYLLPTIIQRIDEVDEVYLQTVFTLGATKLQQITSVFIPAVFAKLLDDLRILTALSWTYIVVAEMINTADGGIGALTYIVGRQARIDKVFALLITIILIGLIQDKLLAWLDRFLFAHKYATKEGG